MAKYRFESHFHDPMDDADLRHNQLFYENKQYSKDLKNRLINADFSYITDISVSVSTFWFETMITTNKELTEKDLKELLHHFNTHLFANTTCTDKWV